MSYAEVEQLIERLTGEKLLSDQTIWRVVVEQAAAMSRQWQWETDLILDTFELPAIEGQVDVYHPQQEEVLVLQDAICVKA